MKKKLNFIIVDDDPVSAKILKKTVEPLAQSVSYSTSSVKAIEQIMEQKPDCVFLDIMMPEIDGLELCKRLRNEPELDDMKIVVVSGKPYEFDRNRAFSFGADGYIMKPIDPKQFPEQLKRILEDHMELAFWGIRGTLPVPGRKAIKYGGNTSCVSLEFIRGNLFIFDAGTGIKELSDHLLTKNRFPIEAKIFISHPHWDHINALPFFVPLYMQGNEFEICGPAHGDATIAELISGQMDGVHFPIKIKEFSARVYFRDLKEEEIDIDGIKLKTMLLNHPGHCLGYRVEYKKRSVCYVTDNELYPESSPYYNKNYVKKLIEFVKGADALITDCTYSDEEYETKVTWGHSSTGRVVDLAHRANVKKLFLIHHDPDHADADIDAKRDTAKSMLKKRKSKTLVIAPKEKQIFKI
jgi:phosphoribosyl 1,2-cyclic phosphodiesterase/CheY-like chemotaxis protein